MKKTNRVLSFVLTLVMVISLIAVVPTTVSAAEPSFVPSENSPTVTDFTDEFTGTALSDKWTLCYKATTAASETVKVADGKFSAVATNWNTFKELKLYTGDASWTDYAVEASISVSAQDPRHAGVFVRAGDIGSGRYALKGYYIAIDTDKRSYVIDGANNKYADLPIQIDIYNVDGSAEKLLKTFEVENKHYAKNTFFDLKVLVCGNTMCIYLDGEYVGSFADDTYKSGYVGVNQYMAAFDMEYFTVRNLTVKEKRDFGIIYDEVVEFTDEFTGTALSPEWTLCYTPTTEAAETIKVADGKFTAAATNYNTYKALKLYTGDPAWKNYTVEASVSVTATDPRHAGIFVRGNDIGAGRYALKGYYVAIDTDKRSYVIDGANNKYADLPIQIDVYDMDGSNENLLKTFEVDGKHFAKNTYFKLAVTVYEDTMLIYLDDIFVGEMKADKYTAGYVGINQYMSAFNMEYFKLRNLNARELGYFGVVIPSVDAPEVKEFVDDFEGDELSNKWTVLYKQNVNSSNANQYDSYSVNNGSFHANSSYWNGLNNLKLYTGKEIWKDYVVETTLKIAGQDPRNCGVFVRATELGVNSNAYKGYYVAIDTDYRNYPNKTSGNYSGGNMRIQVFMGNGTGHSVVETFEVKGKPLSLNTLYDLKVIVCGSSMRIYLDGAFVGQFYDGTYANGFVGLHTAKAIYWAEKFSVRGLRYYEYGEFGIEVEKPDSGEEDKVFSPGVVMMLLLKKKSEGAGTPVAGGTVEVKAVENFTDNFDGSKISDKWTVCYVPTEINGAVVDSLEVKDGFLTASATHWNSVKRLKLYTGDPTWTDYAVEATIAPGGTDPRTIGLLVRADKIGNERYDYTGYYVHLNVDKRVGTALNVQIEKCDGAAGTIVVNKNVDGRSFSKNQAYKLKVLVLGDTMRVYVDDKFVCDYTDSTYTSGCVGINSYMATFKLDTFTVRTLTDKDLREFGVKAAGN